MGDPSEEVKKKLPFLALSCRHPERSSVSQARQPYYPCKCCSVDLRDPCEVENVDPKRNHTHARAPSFRRATDNQNFKPFSVEELIFHPLTTIFRSIYNKLIMQSMV